ncbi:S-adenosyl-methyltransferase MraW [Streptococcus dysgalactiae subsp. dysgalactiae]|uniref:Ribosomal RNA small subunit methyltransferase H n=2 Tax=Streptococcus dysgalactiae TaxID=1334 RepID=A0A380JYV1_STRDY|nr:S-adenosyl-methyltransferase MraW [Streptococcus dysgalactiae subsp. dysgalactiae]
MKPFSLTFSFVNLLKYGTIKVMTKEFHHVTVLLHKTVDMLDIKPNGIYVDATLGGSGHSAYLLSKLSEQGHLYCFDQDQKAIDNAQLILKPYIDKGQVTFIKDNFRHLKARLEALGVTEIDGILYDLGVSSPQLDERERGFSYKQNAPLDMRMDRQAPLTAYDVVNTYPFNDLVKIFFKYGEDKFSKQIARKIEQARAIKPIETTTELAELIKAAKPAKELKKKGHPAKQIFQAIRIEVNDELGAADESIQDAMELLALDGRISVITFHSLEDRLTKQLFKEVSTVDVPKGLPFIPEDMKPTFELVSRKPILPSQEELAANNRAHSAKLRVAKKIRK